jgi:hypothetical protein
MTMLFITDRSRTTFYRSGNHAWCKCVGQTEDGFVRLQWQTDAESYTCVYPVEPSWEVCEVET